VKRVPEEFEPKRVLVIRPRGLGDVVLSSAVVGALHRRYPAAKIDYLTERASRALVETDPRLDRVFLFGGRPDEASDRVSCGGVFDALRWVRRARADMVVDLFSNPFTALVSAVSGGRYRIGLDKRFRRYAYNVRVPRFRGRPEDDHRYAGEVQLDFLRGAGISWPGESRPRLFLNDQATRVAQRIVRDAGLTERRFGVVLPGGSWESKRWSVEGFIQAGRDLARRFGQPTLVVWGPPEREDAEAIARGLGSDGRLAPASTLREMAGVLGLAGLVVATDCVGRHLAIVQEVPTIGVFGSTDPRDWTPREGPHRTVSAETSDSSLRALGAEPVLAEIAGMFDELAALDAARGAH
jgi:heptosyltransferase-3